MEITIIKHLEEFLEIREKWDNLVLSADPDNVYVTSIWLEATIKHLCGDEDLYIMCGWDKGELIVALPFVHSCKKILGGFRFVRYRNITGLYTGHFDFPVLNKDLGPLIELWNEFSRILGKWDEIEMLYVRKDSMAYKLYASIYSRYHKRFREEIYIGSDYLCETQENWNTYYSQLNNTTKRHMTKMKNRINKAASYDVRKLLKEEEIDCCHNDSISLETHSWKGDINSVRTRDYAAFIKEVCKKMIRYYRLHYYVLCINGKKAAFLICAEISSYMIAMVGGFSDSYKYYSPGKYLISRAIEEAHENSCRCIDLYHHSDSYKQEIVITSPVPKYLIRLYNHTFVVFCYKSVLYFKKRWVAFFNSIAFFKVFNKRQ